ncbi:MAG: helix-turn-helix transcriptional regulator [Erysipelotrichaceae bacterium]|nr:helix-turn-helix transcriptional regulator [Erysipelotrichaceae bacterium]
MIFADKIIEERKKNGWSQEELADMLGVFRQAAFAGILRLLINKD